MDKHADAVVASLADVKAVETDIVDTGQTVGQAPRA